MRKNILIGSGALAVTLATVGFIALNMDNSRFLGNSNLSGDVDFQSISAPPTVGPKPIPVAVQPEQKVFLGASSTQFPAAQQNALLGHLNLFQQDYFSSEDPRIDSHLTTDKQVYVPGESIFLSVTYTDPYTKMPLACNPDNDTLGYYDYYWDIFDPFGDRIDWDVITGVGAATPSIIALPGDSLYSGTYTIRVYGFYLAPSYKQIKVVGDLNNLNDFPITAVPNSAVIAPGQNASINYTFSFPAQLQNLTGTATFEVYTDDGTDVVRSINITVPVATSSGSGSMPSSVIKGTYQVPVPANVTSRVAVVFVMVELTTIDEDNNTISIMSSTIAQINIRPLKLQVAFWTENFAPLFVNGTAQRVFAYPYYGEANDFPSQRAFLFPATLPVDPKTGKGTYTLKQNFTNPIAKGQKNATKVLEAKDFTQNLGGIYNFSIPEPTKNSIFYLEFNNSINGTFLRIPVNLLSFAMFYPNNSLLEINIALNKRVLASGENITLSYQTNGLFNASAIYLLVVKQKDRIIWSAFSNFTTTFENKKFSQGKQIQVILPNQPPKLSGTQQFLVYRVTPQWYYFYQHYDNTTQDLDTILTWLQLRASVSFYRRPAPQQLAPLKVVVKTDRATYFPGDLVNFNASVVNATSNAIITNAFLNLAITDASSWLGVGPTDLPASQIAKVHYDNDFPFNNLALPQLNFQDFSNFTDPLVEALLATQIQRYIFSDFAVYDYIDMIETPEDAFNTQRYFGSALYAYSSGWMSIYNNGFTTFMGLNNNQFLALGSKLRPYDYTYTTYIDETEQINSHTWSSDNNIFEDGPQDFTQTVFAAAGIFTNTTGVFVGSFVMNDANNTNYVAYTEAWTQSGYFGSGIQTNVTSVAASQSKEPISIPPPNVPSWAVVGENVTYFSVIQNNLNFPVEVYPYVEANQDDDSYLVDADYFFGDAAIIIPAKSSLPVNVTIQFNQPVGMLNVTFHIEYTIYDKNDVPVIDQDLVFNATINALFNGTFLLNAVSGVIGPNVSGNASLSSKNLNFALSNDAVLGTMFGLQSMLFSSTSEIIMFMTQYTLAKLSGQSMGGMIPEPLTFEDISTSLYVADLTFQYTLATAAMAGLTNEDQGINETLEMILECYNQSYIGILDFYNFTTGGFSSLPNGIPSEVLTLQAINFLSNSPLAQNNNITNFVLNQSYGFINKTRNATSGIWNPSNPKANSTNLLYQSLLISSLAGQRAVSPGNLTKEVQYLIQQVNASINVTDGIRSADPYVLAQTILALYSLNNSRNISTWSYLIPYYTDYLARYLTPEGVIAGSTIANKTVWSPYLSSPIDVQIELNSLASMTFALGGRFDNASRALTYLTNYIGMGIGGNQANYFAISAAMINQMFNISNIPADSGASAYTITVGNDFTDAWESTGTMHTFATNALDTYYGPGDVINANITVVPDVNTDYTLLADQWYAYTIMGYYFNDLSKAGGLFNLAVTQNVSQMVLGKPENLNKNVLYNITVNNTAANNFSTVMVSFQLPSCVGVDPAQNPQLMSPDLGVKFEWQTGTFTIAFRSFAGKQVRSIAIKGTQITAGTCAPRQASVQIPGDNASLTLVRYG